MNDSMNAVQNGSRWIGTSNRGYSVYAMEELQRLFPGAKFRHLVPTEIFEVILPVSFAEVLSVMKENEPVFLRHIHPVWNEISLGEDDVDVLDMALICRQVLRMLAEVTNVGGRSFGYEFDFMRKNVAVQVRGQRTENFAYAPSDVKKDVDTILGEKYACQHVVRDAEWIISIYISAETIYFGVSRPQDNLSDWSGGAIRFAREDDQISRAKFKLLEAEQRFSLDYGDFHRSLDIGAAPGGWTSLLLEKGLEVTAIDPAPLDLRLLHRERLIFLQKNAADVRLAEGQYDLLVCDMSWNPRQMAKLISGLLYALEEGGKAIITLKLMHKKPFRAIRETVEAFQPQLRLLAAKQLFHNRDEVTLLFEK